MNDWWVQVEDYLRLERNEDFRNVVEELKLNNKEAELKQLFNKARLTFGTAGIRGPMGPGFGQMNDLIIVQTSQGLASYLLDIYGEKVCQKRGVIIGHDARHNSARFSRLAAMAFLQKSIPVYFNSQIVATPLIAYGVGYFNCLCGIMVTASHNPKQDNGYKVYWSNGAQILTPHDQNIQQHIMLDQNQELWSVDLSYGHEYLTKLTAPATIDDKQPTLVDQTKPEFQLGKNLYQIYDELCRSYFAHIQQLVSEQRQLNSSTPLTITYTAMHGVGHKFLSKALQIAGFDRSHPVRAQMEPDPEFPTVKFPNPEEAGALDLAFETAAQSGSTLILANDPDSDRCAAALYCPISKRRRVLTGNEIGQLLGWWAWHQHQHQHEHQHQDRMPTTSNAATKSHESKSSSSGKQQRVHAGQNPSKKPEDCYMLSTAVSSRFLQSMASVEGFRFIETLTGFKYMGNTAYELMKRGKSVLFAYEEAIGYMVDSQILDKDGISAAIQLAQCAAYLIRNHNQRTLEDQLEWLYSKYGYHYSLNSYYLCTDQRVIKKIFHELQSNYPKSFKCNDSTNLDNNTEFVVTRIRDLNNGIDNGTRDHKPDLPISSSSFMVTFWIGDEIRFTIRTSGTEPKIKYYSEIVTKLVNTSSEHEQKQLAEMRLKNFVNLAVERCLRPSFYQLEPAAG